ncbi:uncharacterized protein C16orf96 homolog isoform X2 [Tympanuchus pallidicinctus]|uniref:uncharacterized protein C16orf96 homolog isoform X2 n=1 Tax=Tympanuchus pallidicinctus TaxID=109042 RepID=UPI002286ECA7|nr:uncharacterized protein C16orf96 homolog isoform X2 [Tympanuchus pallidicinctus]
MSVAVTLAELADVAFRTARGCGVNAGALQLLLRGLLEHLRLQNAATHLSEDERGLLQPEVSARPPILLHPGHSGGSLGVTELLSSGQGPGTPAADTEQMVQLRKRIEVIEEGMTKVTDTLQEVLTNTCSLKTTIQAFQEELQLLKDSFQKTGLEELREQVIQQDKHSHLLQNILSQMVEVRQQLSSFPWQTGMLCSLCRLPAGELSSQDLIPESSQEPALEAPCRLSGLLEQHESVETCITCSKSTLQQHAGLGTSENVATEKMQGEGSDFSREVLNQVGQLQEQCTRLQEAAEQLWGDSKDTQKADETTLETKASQDELQNTMAQLSEMMQDLLQRMFLHGQDRHKASELTRERNSKAQRQQTWRLSKQCHCQRPYFDTSSANRLKRNLFDPMKCISCDRPLAAAPRLPLVTVRKASAGGSDCLAQQLPGRETKGRNQISQGPTAPTRPPSASSSLTTICPFGVPADLTYNNGQVDILGIDGIIYKGKLSSQATNGTATRGRDFPGTKSPRPSAQHTAEKVRRNPKYGSQYVSPYSCAAMRTRMVSSAGRWLASDGGSRMAGV